MSRLTVDGPSLQWVVMRLFLVTCLFAAGCTLWAERREPLSELPLQTASLDRLVALLQEQGAAVHTLKGLFRAKIQGPGIPVTQHVEGAVFYQRPDALRLQGYNRMGMKLFELALGDDHYTLRMVNGKLLTGQLGDLNRAEQVAVPFRLSVLAMTGVIGTPPPMNGEHIVLAEEGETYRLDIYLAVAGTAKTFPYRRVWVERRRLQVVREDRLNPGGGVDASVEFDDFRTVQGSPAGEIEAEASAPLVRPFRVVAQDGQGQSRIQLTFHEIIPNPELKPEELQVTGEGQPVGTGRAT